MFAMLLALMMHTSLIQPVEYQEEVMNIEQGSNWWAEGEIPEDTYLCSDPTKSTPPTLSGIQDQDIELCFDSYAEHDSEIEKREKMFLKTYLRSPATDSELCWVYKACDGPEVGEPIKPYTVKL